MYVKTSALAHGKYFDTVTAPQPRHTVTISRNYSDTFLQFDKKITVTAHSGISLIILTDNPQDKRQYQEFVLQGSIAIHPHIYFNVLSITDSCSIYFDTEDNERPHQIKSPNPLVVRDFVEQLSISKVYGFFYQVKTPPYAYNHDQHDYFEMTIVDQGELIHEVDGQKIHAKKHDCLIYFPNQVHSQKVVNDGVTTYLSIMFSAAGIAPSLRNKLVHLGNNYTYLLEKMVELSNHPQSPYYADEMINLFKSIIIQMLKGDHSVHEIPSTSMRENYESELFQSIIEYLHHHVESENQVNDLVTRFSLSRSTLQLLFKKYANMTPKNYINRLRLKRSKLLIKESKLSLSEIAETLGYGSLQYFSRVFNQEFGVSPSSYAKSLNK